MSKWIVEWSRSERGTAIVEAETEDAAREKWYDDDVTDIHTDRTDWDYEIYPRKETS